MIPTPTGLTLCLQLHESISWRGIVRSLPLTFVLHAVLRRRMTEAGIDAGQRTLADLGQHVHGNAGLFFGVGVGHMSRVAAGPQVRRILHRAPRLDNPDTL